MRQPWGIYAGVLFGLAGILVVFLLIQNRKAGGPRREQNKEETAGIYLLLYRWMIQFWPFKSGLLNIRARLIMSGITGERPLRKRSVQIMMTVALVTVVLLVMVGLITRQPVMILLMAMALWFLAETIIDLFVIRLGNRLLRQQIHLNDRIRHRYYEYEMVDEAIYQACQDLAGEDHAIGIQGQRIYDVLNARDVEKEMAAYSDTAPNKFLRMLMGLGYMTMEYGDSRVDGASVLMKNLSDLTAEIRIELGKREKILYALNSLNVIALVPLFCIAPIRRWAEGYFMPLKTFYNSQTGFLLEVTTIGLVFVAYLFLRRLQRFDRVNIRRHERLWPKRLYEKGFKGLVDRVALLKTRKVYRNLLKRLRDGGSDYTPEAFATLKCMSFLLGLICSGLFLIGAHLNQVHQIYTAPTLSATFLGGQLTGGELAKAVAITKMDNAYLKEMEAGTSRDEILVILGDSGLAVDEVEMTADRLMQKKSVVYSLWLHWWQVLLILAVACLFYQGPEIYLLFQRRLMAVEVEDEVAGFGSIILMLMHHERLTAEDILEWLEMYSVVLKSPISDCLNNYASGPYEALERLKSASSHERFQRIVNSLQLAVEELSIRQAFDELASEKAFYIEDRKMLNERIVEKKVNLGNMLGFLPLYGMIMLYMVIPMIVVSINDLDRYFNQISL